MGKILIKHIMADGHEVDSVEGFVVPATGVTTAVYKIVADFICKSGTPVCSNEDRKR
jgi:hypothetical protein